MKLLTQADDFGFTKGVTAGIIDAIENGMLRNTGLFMNMPGTTETAAAYAKANGDKACFGIDFNLVSGPSVADPKEIPHLVDEDGNFIRSSVRIKDPRWQTEEGRRELFPADETAKEIRAQYDRYVELVGRKPGYLHGHSLTPETYNEAIRALAKETGVPYSFDLFEEKGFSNLAMELTASKASSSKVFDPNYQINKDPEGIIWEHREEFLKVEYADIIGHTGFLDAALFDLTSLSIERVRDHQTMTSKRLMDYFSENGVELVTYDDVVKG